MLLKVLQETSAVSIAEIQTNVPLRKVRLDSGTIPCLLQQLAAQPA